MYRLRCVDDRAPVVSTLLDLDEDGTVESDASEDDDDLVQSGSGSYAPPSGPKCPSCPLTCAEGTDGNCP